MNRPNARYEFEFERDNNVRGCVIARRSRGCTVGHTPWVRREKELWACPKCGRRFVGRNMWHACGDYSVERLLEGKGDRARELLDRFESLIAACGPYEVAPAKTRVAFMGRVRFAGVNAISDRGMTIAFALPRAMQHPRIRKVENIAPGWYGHWMRISSPDDLDDELLDWLRESYHQMGLQERLAK